MYILKLQSFLTVYEKNSHLLLYSKIFLPRQISFTVPKNYGEIAKNMFFAKYSLNIP